MRSRSRKEANAYVAATATTGRYKADTVGLVEIAVDNPWIERELNVYISRFVEKVGETTFEALRRTLAEGIQAGETVTKLRDRVMGVIDDATKYRAEMIARTESTNAVEAGQEIAWVASEVVESKRWIANADACEFCAALDGMEVPLGETFASLGATIAGEEGGTMTITYGDVYHPTLHPHCRCDTVPVLKELSNATAE